MNTVTSDSSCLTQSLMRVRRSPKWGNPKTVLLGLNRKQPSGEETRDQRGRCDWTLDKPIHGEGGGRFSC
jgi:hypothetical protein